MCRKPIINCLPLQIFGPSNVFYKNFLLIFLSGEGDDKASPTGTAPAGGAIGAAGAAAAGAAAGVVKGAYVAPGRREGGRAGESMNDRRRSKILIF